MVDYKLQSPLYNQHKMQRSVLSLVLLLLAVVQVPRVSGTGDIVIGTATVLTANQLGALAVLGLGLKVVALKASLLASRGRGRRAAEEVTELEAIQEVFNIEALVELEEEDCFKRIFCAAGTNTLKNKNVTAMLSLLSVDLATLTAPMSRGAEKFVTAAAFGKLSQNVEKCEARYACPLKLESIQKLYPFSQS